MTIDTPCTRLCRLSPDTGLCEGCGRAGEEIAGWSTYSPQLRREIMAALPARLARLGSAA